MMGRGFLPLPPLFVRLAPINVVNIDGQKALVLESF